MKFYYILFAFIALFAYKSLAHDYQTVYSDRVAYFQDENKTVHCIKIDSVNFDGDSILYPMASFNQNSSDCVNPWDLSILGNRILINSEYNSYLSPQSIIKIKINAEIKEKWLFTVLESKVRVEAEIISIENDSFLGIVDSVKTIKLSVFDTNNIQQNNHNLNNKLIKLSKHFGMISIPNFSNQLNFKSFNLIGLSNPQIGFQNFGTFDIFDYQIGDEIHIVHSYTHYNDYTDRLIILKYLNRVDFKDSIIYTVERTYKYIKYQESTKTMDSIYSQEIITEKIIKDPIFEILPNEVFLLNKDEVSTSTISIDNDFISKNTDRHYFKNELDSCWSEMIDSYNCVSSYIKGIGGPFYSCPEFPDNYTYNSNSLVYYKKGNKTWGKPLIMTSIENELADIQIDVFPNPSANFLNISLPDLDKQYQITLIDLNSNIVLEQKLTSNQNKLDISSLSNGMYIYRIFVNNSELKTGKIIKNDLFK